MSFKPFKTIRVNFNPGAAKVFGREYEEIPILVPERILVFSPHPDDETISCGGMIYKYARFHGSQIIVLLVKGAEKRRLEEFDKALQSLGCDEVNSRCLDFDIDSGFNDEIIGKLANKMREIRPQWVFLPHPEDRHRTHRAVSEAVLESVYHAGSNTYLEEAKYYTSDQLEKDLFKGPNADPVLSPWLPMGIFYYESPSFRFEYRSQVQAPMVVCDISGEPYETKLEILDNAYAETVEDIDSYKRWTKAVADQRGALIYSYRGEAFAMDTHHVPIRSLPV